MGKAEKRLLGILSSDYMSLSYLSISVSKEDLPVEAEGSRIRSVTSSALQEAPCCSSGIVGRLWHSQTTFTTFYIMDISYETMSAFSNCPQVTD